MKIIRILLIVISFLPQETIAQKFSVMATYGQSTFMYCPGIEINYFFNDKLGVNIGSSAYFLDYKPEQLVNISNYHEYHFHSLNIGLCGTIVKSKKFKAVYIIGRKIYHSPLFAPVYFLNSENHYIYYDRRDAKGGAYFGLDTGLLFYIKKYIFGVKFDTAFSNLYQTRYVLGWSF